ncbi:hypothetical protein [Dactylosporangium sp. NPDC049140]|uniref:hypothetical protein n=1 Tax=Dactylosporangium sp. NPDC049140 TaxID=3155647 RepID=UPI0033DEB7DD
MRHRLLRALAQRIQWRNALNAARDRAAQYEGSGGDVGWWPKRVKARGIFGEALLAARGR